MYPNDEQSGGKPAVSPWGALVKVIMEPAATFEALRDRMPVLPGYVLQMVVLAAVLAVTLPNALNMTADLLSKQAGVTPQMMSITKTFSIVGGVVGSLATPWVAGVVVAAFAIFFGQFQGGGVRFSSYLGMIGYARLPLVLSAIVSTPLTMQAKTLQQVQNFSISLAVLLPPDANRYLKAFFQTLNPFDLWYYALLVIGFAALHRVKPARSLWFVVSIYGLSLLLALGSAALAGKTPGLGM
ncbi:MAG TPA: YIP1 family protein [Symbiobacteriaceae bacterium]|jgi:hypothetical protein